MSSLEIVTGEAVALDIPPAGAASRLLAGLIDGVIAMVLYIGLIMLAFWFDTLGVYIDDAAIISYLIGTMIVVYLVMPVTVETLTKGRSVGKFALGIQIVQDDGGPVRFRQCLIRAMTAIIELWGTIGALAFFVSVFNNRGKRIGDFLAGTYAVRVRVPVAEPPVVMPPALAPWAATADIRALPDGLALRIRQFLARARTMNPVARDATGLTLAQDVERFVSPGPPIGTHPEFFLAAVAAARRDRDFAMLSTARRAVGEEAAWARVLPHRIPDPPN